MSIAPLSTQKNPYSIRIGSSMFDFSHIETQTVNLLDVIKPLSRVQRFNGHTNKKFSVLQHSYFVGLMIYNDTRNATQTLAGMIHDFHEAFVTDVPTPLKNLMRDIYGFSFRPITDSLDEMLIRSLDIEFVRDALYSETTHSYDALSLTHELAKHFTPGFIRAEYVGQFAELLDYVQTMTEEEIIEAFTQMYAWVAEDARQENLVDA